MLAMWTLKCRFLMMFERNLIARRRVICVNLFADQISLSLDKGQTN